MSANVFQHVGNRILIDIWRNQLRTPWKSRLVAHLWLAPLVWNVRSSSIDDDHLLHVLKRWVCRHCIMIGELRLLCIACDGCVCGRGWEEGGENKFYSVVLHRVTNFHTCTSYSIDGRAQCMEGWEIIFNGWRFQACMGRTSAPQPNA